MSGVARLNTRVLLALASGLLLSTIAYAEDLSGLWATDGSKCSQIFTKAGASYVFAQNSDIYGSGFIIDGRRIVTQMAKCDIKTSNQDGATWASRTRTREESCPAGSRAAMCWRP